MGNIKGAVPSMGRWPTASMAGGRGERQGGAVAGLAALSPMAVLGAITAWEEKQEVAMRPSARRPI